MRKSKFGSKWIKSNQQNAKPTKGNILLPAYCYFNYKYYTNGGIK